MWKELNTKFKLYVLLFQHIYIHITYSVRKRNQETDNMEEYAWEIL